MPLTIMRIVRGIAAKTATKFNKTKINHKVLI